MRPSLLLSPSEVVISPLAFLTFPFLPFALARPEVNLFMASAIATGCVTTIALRDQFSYDIYGNNEHVGHDDHAAHPVKDAADKVKESAKELKDKVVKPFEGDRPSALTK